MPSTAVMKRLAKVVDSDTTVTVELDNGRSWTGQLISLASPWENFIRVRRPVRGRPPEFAIDALRSIRNSA